MTPSSRAHFGRLMAGEGSNAPEDAAAVIRVHLMARTCARCSARRDARERCCRRRGSWRITHSSPEAANTGAQGANVAGVVAENAEKHPDRYCARDDANEPHDLAGHPPVPSQLGVHHVGFTTEDDTRGGERARPALRGSARDRAKGATGRVSE